MSATLSGTDGAGEDAVGDTSGTGGTPRDPAMGATRRGHGLVPSYLAVWENILFFCLYG